MNWPALFQRFLSGKPTMTVARILTTLVLAAGASVPPAHAQVPAEPQGKSADPALRSESVFGVLPGRWLRTDGNYEIIIKQVDGNGKLNATYANPRPLPFSKAEAAREGETVKLFFELSAGGYSGSTYTLSYDPAGDFLVGVYYQAVARQKFDVRFMRAK